MDTNVGSWSSIVSVTPHKSVATLCFLFICDQISKVRDTVIVCCYFDHLATLRESQTAYFRAVYFGGFA